METLINTFSIGICLHREDCALCRVHSPFQSASTKVKVMWYFQFALHQRVVPIAVFVQVDR